jgi:hypothetical protein
VQWDKVENKTTVVAYGVGGIVLIWFSSTLVTALNSIPLVRGGKGVYAAHAQQLRCTAIQTRIIHG